MHNMHTYPDLTTLLMICPIQTKRRLAKTCFRGKYQPLAGNFRQWETVDQVLGDVWIKAELTKEVLDLIKQKAFGVHSVTISHGMDVGWESTDPLDQFSSDELEPFYPNGNSEALRVALPSKLNRKAPLTNEVTFVFALALMRGQSRFELKSLYPGTDIGELYGDISAREQRVFYGWEHPGV